MRIPNPHLRLTRAMALSVALMASACGQLHEEIPPGVSYEPGSIDVRGPGDPIVAETGEPGSTEASGARGAPGAGTSPAPVAGTDGRADPAEETILALESRLHQILEDNTATSGAEQAAAMTVQDLTGSTAGIAPDNEPDDAVGDGLPELLDAQALDLTGDDVPSIVTTWDQAGVPALVAVYDAREWRVSRLAGVWPNGGREEGVTVLGDPADFDGDGVNELVYAADSLDGHSTVIRIARYSGDNGLVDVIFETTSRPGPERDAPESWSVVAQPDGTTARLRTTCDLEGPFDIDGAARPREERTYMWTTDGVELGDRSVPAPESASELANVAEAALRSGDLDTAEALFRQAVDAAADDPDTPTDGVDWRALGMLRLGWLYAMEGRTAQARIAVAAAVGGGGGIGDVADAFLAAYDTADAPRALAASLAARATVTSGLGPDEVLWPGHVLAAWVTRHGIDTLGDEPATTLRVDLGLPIRGASLVDLDGDGGDEVAVLLDRPDGTVADLWIVDPGEPAAAAIQVTSGDIQLGDGTDLPGNLVGLNLIGSQPSSILGWDGNVPALFDSTDLHTLIAYPPGRDPQTGHEACSVHP